MQKEEFHNHFNFLIFFFSVAHAGLQTSFAVGDTGSQWWTQVNDFESKKQVQARLNDFMFRICFYPHDNATIVIGTQKNK